MIKTRSQFQCFICILIAGKTIILTLELMVGFADFLLFCVGLLFFLLGLFSATRNSINSEKIFVFNSFQFMPAQQTRFGIDWTHFNSCQLSRRGLVLTEIALSWSLHETLLYSQNSFYYRELIFSPARLFCMVVVQSRNWLSSMTLDFAGTNYQSNFTSLCKSCNYDCLIVILGLQWIW